MVLNTIIRKLHLPSPLPDMAHSLLRLPASLGGCGIRSLLKVSSAAYFSSVALASPFILDTVRTFIPSLASSSSSSSSLGSLQSLKISKNIADSMYEVIRLGVPSSSSLLPRSPNEFWHLYSGTGRLQKDLMKLINTSDSDSIMQSTQDPMIKTKLISCQVPNSGVWLNVIPSASNLFLMDSHFALAVRLRLGLPPQEGLPLLCKCGASLTADHGHFLSCKLLRRTIVLLAMI